MNVGDGTATRVDDSWTKQYGPEIEGFLKKHGDFTLAFSTVQPGLQHYVTEWGYLAYKRLGGITIAMGDPVAEQCHHEEILIGFLKNHRRATFWQVTEPMARVLEREGMYINHFGADMQLHLPTYTFTGKKKQKLRQAMRRWARQEEGEHYEIKELSFAEIDPELVKTLSADWMKTRIVRRRELKFLTRQAVFADEADVRKFYAFKNGQLQGYVFFDPVYRDGEVIGYSTAVKRRKMGSPTGMEEAITGQAIEKFQAEGREYLYLGLLPLYQLDDTGFRTNKLLGGSFRFLGTVWQ